MDQTLELFGVLLGVQDLLQNPNCAAVLGGIKQANALLNRATFYYAKTANPDYRGSNGNYYDPKTGVTVAGQARRLASTPGSTVAAFSEIGGKNVYLTDRFFHSPDPDTNFTGWVVTPELTKTITIRLPQHVGPTDPDVRGRSACPHLDRKRGPVTP